MGSEHIPVSVGGRVLRISNLDKVLYPDTGFTKRDVLDYYVAVADALLPRLAERPVTLMRFPDGADREGFFEKHAARHAPEWVRTARIPTRSGTAEYVFLEELPALVWAANLAALELHVPQWRIGEGARVPDQLVFDLDPGAPAGIVECCRVAVLLREALARDGLCAYPKTSGSKGMQLYVPITATEEKQSSRYAKRLAERLAGRHPELITATMTKAVRPGRVFIDWSQNNPAKTTIVAYSLRARPEPAVSTPLRWAEVERGEPLAFGPGQVRERLAEHGDLLAGMDDSRAALPSE
ncbi:non-homologous end-joining DNA ligase [Sciscionella sediminilitoris]|uniref:non-homologous end-joining DNA ligase n=1 Tax=Sciscionella sediminilitoris TaxID=1445613 RepID=UPI0004DEEBCF|nr:non-homologous end-joining DNA ligase [Sciscionella sp. SE31]